MSALRLAYTATRPRAERPWWLRRPGILGIGLLVLFAMALGALVNPAPAQAFLGIDINPAHWAIKGFTAILNYLFGNEIKSLAKSLVAFLLNMPDISSRASFGQLNAYFDDVQGAGWALLSLSFIAAVMHYWSSSYTASGADTSVRAFGRTIMGIGMLVSLPEAIHLTIGAMNLLADGLINNSIVGHGLSSQLEQTFSGGFSSGGIGLLVGIGALVCAIMLLVTKVVTIALLAVFYILAPLAIGLWPFEPLSWALKTLAGATLALLVFPVVWAASFGVFAVLSSATLVSGGVGSTLGNSIVNSLVGLASLIIAIRLPFAVLRLGMGAGLLPSPSRGLQTAYYAKSALAALA